MSIDISHLGAHLSDAQRSAVQAQYDQRAKSPTAAFLLCFFLGIFGAHRFYLGQTGAGLLRLIISPLVIPGIIWEIYDLLHIDNEVNASNLKLAEQLVAKAALAAPIPAAVVARLNAEPPRAGQPAVAVVTPISGDAAQPAAHAAPAAQPAPQPAPAPDDDAPPVWPVVPAVATADAAPSLAAGPDSDITAEMVAGAAAIADAEAPISPGQAGVFAAPEDRFADETPAAAPLPPTAAEAPAYAPRLDDPTDRGLDTAELLALADVGEVTGERVVVRLPSPVAPAPAPAPDWTDMAEAGPTPAPGVVPSAVPDEEAGAAPPDTSPIVVPADADMPGYAETMAVPLAAEDATLLLVPAELAAAPEPVPMPEMSVASASEPPASEPPASEMPASEMPASAETQVSEEPFDRLTDTGSHRIVKRVKVVRRLVVNGQVVEEATAEQVVDADADTSATARSLQESLRGNDFQKRIAALSSPVAPPPPGSSGSSSQPGASATDQPDTPADQSTQTASN